MDGSAMKKSLYHGGILPVYIIPVFFPIPVNPPNRPIRAPQ
jgi:hypothetical protein